MDYNTLLLTNNECYSSQVGKVNKKPTGIVVHSTGANACNLRRYVNTDDGRLGKNKYGNHWNRKGVQKCVHAMIGRDKDGVVCTYQLLPLNICAWGVGNGSKGSYNYDPVYLQFEICEDALDDEDYYSQVMSEAKELCARWCKEFGIPVKNVVSHKEAHAKGYASNHGDIDHWLKKFGDSMDGFRKDVASLLEENETPESTSCPYNIEVVYKDLRIRKGAGTNYAKVGFVEPGVHTIVDESIGEGATKWGLLKQYEDERNGWISLDYVTKVENPVGEKVETAVTEEPKDALESTKTDTVKEDEKQSCEGLEENAEAKSSENTSNASEDKTEKINFILDLIKHIIEFVIKIFKK